MNNLKNIIFDLGGVLMNFDFAGAGEKFSHLGLPISLPDSVNSRHRTQEAKPNRADEAINAYINGFVSEEQFAAVLLPHCKKPGVTTSDIVDTLYSLDGSFPAQRINALVKLRTRYKVFLLSNINRHMWTRTQDMLQRQGYKPQDCFDDTFLSFEMLMAKPSPDIFVQMISKTGINPQETIYFDDLVENTEAGAALGLQAQLVKSNRLEDCQAYTTLLNNI